MRTVLGAAVTALTVIATPLAAGADTTRPGCTVVLSDHAQTGTDASNGVDTALDALRDAGSGTLCVDGQYTISRPINLDRLGQDRSIRVVGESTDRSGFTGSTNTALVTQTDRTPKTPGSPYLGVYQYGNTFEGLTFTKPPNTSGPIFDYLTGAQVAARYVNLKLDHQGTSGVLFNIGPNHQAHGNTWTGLRLMHTPTNRDNMFAVKTYNHGFNNNLIEASTFYGRGSTGAPAVEFRSPGGGRYTTNVIRSVTFQNTDGGAFHGYRLDGGGVYDSAEWDTLPGRMMRDVFRVGNGTSNFTFSGLGLVAHPGGGSVLASGRHLVAIGRGSAGMWTPATTGVAWTGLAY